MLLQFEVGELRQLIFSRTSLDNGKFAKTVLLVLNPIIALVPFQLNRPHLYVKIAYVLFP